MPIGIRATVDFAFKLTFGNPEHWRVTAHLLNSILECSPPIERLENAHTLTLAEIERMFPDREFSEAASVLETISKAPELRRLYDVRLKLQRD
jgi:hypothetical protein